MEKIVDFHYTVTTSVHLANENNAIETKVQLSISISSYWETRMAIFHSLLIVQFTVCDAAITRM